MDDIALTLLLRAVAKQPFFDTLMRCACDHSANDRFSHDGFFGCARSAASLHAATNVRCIQGGHITWRRTFSVKRTMAWPWLLQISSTCSRTDAHSPHVSAAEHGCEQHALGPALGGPCGHHPVLPMNDSCRPLLHRCFAPLVRGCALWVVLSVAVSCGCSGVQLPQLVARARARRCDARLARSVGGRVPHGCTDRHAAFAR